MNILRFLVLLLCVVSCAPIYVNYDFEKDTNFSKYKTYNYYSDMQTGLSELDTKRLLDALDLQMKAHGFSLSETPDFFIDIKSNEFQQAQRSTVGVGLGGGGRNVGGGISIGLPVGQANINRQITFDFVDEKNNKGLFWQAVSESSFNPNVSPEKREVHLNSIVKKVLSKYPPKS
ncbi:DUF4136 domain-containing protein [Aestuariivivens sp. NBU2969]|uniref:DUF4136 domain-containing protein n=1 Tax=Aestuariivivens sp. NBU2969 TaxID=2873267 RepID=UPI001CBE7B92|nr:DUF4136 domain-containing protein [Aestuariivivens sp. NBU2969]